MSADDRAPSEEQFTALFAAGEEAVAAGQGHGPPSDTPAEVRARLERDLACAQLLRLALRRPPALDPKQFPGSPETSAAPPPQPPPVTVASAAAASPELASDIRALLHRRLRLGSLLILGLFTYFTIFSVRRAILNPEYVLEHGVYFLLDWLVFVGSALLTALLWRKRSRPLEQLRGIELAFLGLILADMAWNYSYDLVFIVGQLAQFQAMGRTVEEGEDLLFLYSCTWSQGVVILIVGYATLIPSGWRRCTLVVSLLGATPLTISTAAGLLSLPTAATFLLFFTLPMAVFLTIAVVVAAAGSHRIEMLRKEASEARKLGQYQLKQHLGTGGMGEVYLAEHVLLKQPCAIKLIRPERAGDPANLRRFEREVQATARLKHWNTVQIYDYGRAADGTFYYVMEYLPGLTLEQLVKRHGPLPPGRAVRLLGQACAALREAHAIGLIHRDVKPANMMLCERGGVHDVVKLLDFGLVKAAGLDCREDRLTQEGAIAGTPAYLSPEQASGKDHLDARSDVYSLGAVAYFLLSGQPPFPRERPMQMLVAHIHEPVRPLTDLRAEVPADLQAVVLRCLEKDPARRFPDADSLQEALAACGCAGQWTDETAARWWRAQAEIGRPP